MDEAHHPAFRRAAGVLGQARKQESKQESKQARSNHEGHKGRIKKKKKILFKVYLHYHHDQSNGYFFK
jgi:hypothetical protein